MIASAASPPLDGRHPLEQLLGPLWPAEVAEQPEAAGNDARVVSRAGEGAPTWLRAGEWRVFARPARTLRSAGDETIESFSVAGGESVHASLDNRTGDVVVPFSLAEAYAGYVSEAWREAGRSLSLSPWQLNAFYRVKALVPSRLLLAARRLLIRAQGVPDFPAWPVDTSVARLLRFYARCALRAARLREGEFVWFWPEGFRAAVILTHDVEGADGIRLALELADLEQSLGFRSSFNFGAWYEIDPGVLRELVDRGFEVGMHGLSHDRELFSSRRAFEERLPGLAELAERLGAVGFRSPATHRVFEWLAELPVDYDCTMPNSDPVRAAAGRLLLGAPVLRRIARRASVHPPAGSHPADAARAPVSCALARPGGGDRARARADPVRVASGPGLSRRCRQAGDLRGVPARPRRSRSALACAPA